VSAATTSTRSESFRTAVAILTFRPNGEVGEDRNISMVAGLFNALY
jgi:hypothetical protein